jgi:hypothetical protein
MSDITRAEFDALVQKVEEPMNNGWPGEPGVPLNPERDGWHWCERDGGLEPRFWSSGQQLWTGSRNSWISPKMLLALFGYAGPCLTPAEVEAVIAIARKDALGEKQ